MIALDTNILIPVLVRSQPEHHAALAWLRTRREPLVTTGVNVGEVLRLLTHPRVFPHPMALAAAVALFDSLLAQFQITILEESDTWWRDLVTLDQELPGIRGNEIFDARIALCLRHNGVKLLCSLDADFAKYPFLRLCRFS